jgi:hypothetical protein
MTSKDRLNLAAKAVRLAVQHKDLPPVKSQLCAGGCGRRAEHYHHFTGYEDWQLLDVIPVCRYCHFLADQIRNQENIDWDREEVQALLTAIEGEKDNHRRRRLYLMKEFKTMESRCRYLVSKHGSNPVAILSDPCIVAFSEYMHNRQTEGVSLSIECVLCGCVHSRAIDDCKCLCHIE